MAVGLVFVAPFFFPRVTGPPQDGSTDDGLRVIHADNDPDRSRHGLRLSQIVARSHRETPGTTELVAIEFSLENVGEQPLTFSETFVAARDPSGGNRDFGYSHQGLTLAPGETVRVKADTVVDAAGPWRFWPCYIIADGEADEDSYCPERCFAVRVQE